MGELVPMLGVYGAAALRVMPSLNRILQYAAQMKLAGSAVDIIYDDLSALDEGGIEALHAHMTGAGGEATGLEPPHFPFAHEIRVQALDYDYPGAPAPTLAGIDFTIRKGESLGLVGASGSGKTTLADILLGLLPPTRGRVLVDGGDIADNLPGWRRRLGYVPQSIYLTDDTLGHNVALGVRDPDIDSSRVQGALHMAQLEDLVDSQPGKLDTMIGERGIRLSGGQRQRVGIARALYRDPDILILDEATSALDGATEQEISKAIESVSREKTLIVIAHRMNTVRQCGRLLFLKDGRLSAMGTYDDLMRDNPDFRTMVALSEEGGEVL
jgi:ATP-binding cassette subfamily C protein